MQVSVTSFMGHLISVVAADGTKLWVGDLLNLQAQDNSSGASPKSTDNKTERNPSRALKRTWHNLALPFLQQNCMHQKVD